MIGVTARSANAIWAIARSRSYAHCLPYFKRMENAPEGEDRWRGREGPLRLERGPARGPLFDAFFEAVQQAGHSLNDDVNGAHQEGFGRFDRNLHRGLRQSAARAYVHPVKRRPNLDVVSRAFVTRIVFEGKRAVGVEYIRKGRVETANADVRSSAVAVRSTRRNSSNSRAWVRPDSFATSRSK